MGASTQVKSVGVDEVIALKREERDWAGSDCLSTSGAKNRRSAWLKAKGCEAQPHSLETTAIHSVCSSTFADVALHGSQRSR